MCLMAPSEIACSMLRDSGEKSFSKKKCENARPFPKSHASYFRFARFNTSALYYLRAWHRLRQREQSVTQHIVLSDGTVLIPFPEWRRPLTVLSIGQETSHMCCQWLLPVSISLHFTSFLHHLSFSSSKNSKRNNNTKVLYCTDVFTWHQAIHSTYKMTPTYVRYMLQVFFGLFFSFLYKIPRYIMQGITSRVC